MGAVLATSGGYVNAIVDQVMSRLQIAASRVVLCGHQHGAALELYKVFRQYGINAEASRYLKGKTSPTSLCSMKRRSR